MRGNIIIPGLATLVLASLATSLPAETLYTNGNILTMDGPSPAFAEAVVADDQGKIAFVGKRDEAASKFPDADLKDLDGKTMLPSFIDPHGHFMFALQMVNQVNVSVPPVGPVTNIEAILKELKAFQIVNAVPKGEWIVGWGYDNEGLAEQRHVTKADLDPIFPDHKVMIIHVSGHGAVLNSNALEWAGVDETTQTPDGGIIARVGDTMEPAGLLMETAYLPVFERFPQPSETELLDLMKPAQMMYASNGYTHAQEGATHIRDIRFLQKAAAQGRLFLDLISLPIFTEAAEVVGNPEFQFGRYENGFKLQGIKIVQDGSPQAKTAYVSTPYLTGGPSGEENWQGEPTLPKDDFIKMVQFITDNGLQTFVHVNGDGAIDQLIEATRAAGLTAADDRRTIAIHSQFQRPEHLDSPNHLEDYVELGISPSYFTNHTYFWGDTHIKNIGREKADFISPVAAAVDQGLTYSNHSDFNVTPLDPMFILWTAMARTTRSGEILGADQRVDAYTALQGLTTGPAWQIFEEGRKGMIKEGLLADFVILSANPIDTSVDQVRDIAIVETIKEGQPIFVATTNVANPSATFCVEQGGTYDIRDGSDGKVGICVLADGTEVDAWSHFRGNAPNK